MAEKIVEVCKVKPSLGSPTDIYLPLTFFDLPCIVFPPVQMLFFYEPPPYPDHIIPKLKHSLSLTLQHFVPIAGNLVWPQSSNEPFVCYKKGDGVTFTVAQSSLDFNYLSGKSIRECNIFQPLVPRIVGSKSKVPVFAVKITLFPNKEICIGIIVHHSLFDAKSVTLFMRSWAWIFKYGGKGGLSTKLAPIFNRTSIREKYAKLENSCIEILKRNGVDLEWDIHGSVLSLDKVRGTFELSGSDVKKLKKLVRARSVNHNQRELIQDSYVSTFAVTYAYTILCLVEAKGVITSNKIIVTFVFDCRNRLEPPVSANYFGNCIGPCVTYINTEEILGRDGIVVVANAITKSIKSLDHEALKGAEEWVPNMFRSVADKGTLSTSVSGTNRFEFQSIDFGWGKPRKVDTPTIDISGGFIFTQGGDSGGGIEIELSLNKGEMEKFGSVFAEGLGKMELTLAAL